MYLKSSNELENTRVILVRHGQSTFNAQGIYQGRSDESFLTEKGRTCAHQTGLAFKGISFDAIYTSPLKRAYETASEILAALSPEFYTLPSLELDDNLREIELLAWQGLKIEYVRQQFAEEYRIFRDRPHEFQMQIPQDGGSDSFFPVLDLYEQARQFWQNILPRHVGKTVLVVSHGGTIRALINTALGLLPEGFNRIQQSNCGISVLNFEQGCTSNAQIEALNLTTHIGETLPKLKAGKYGLRLLLVASDVSIPMQVHHLAEFLKPVCIDFSLSSDLESAQASVEFILQHHPTTVQLQVLRQDFPHLWQQTIYSRRSLDNQVLVTGLVVACTSIIESILGQVLGMKSDQLWRLQLKEGAMCVVHYPSADSSPVLQAMNMADSMPF